MLRIMIGERRNYYCYRQDLIWCWEKKKELFVCYRQDLEVPQEGSYFSFKGSPRSESNSERVQYFNLILTWTCRKWKWWIPNNFILISTCGESDGSLTLKRNNVLIWMHGKWKWDGIISGSWLRAALDQLVPQQDKVKAHVDKHGLESQNDVNFGFL